jgi:GT2 family glycosyltransferase
LIPTRNNPSDLVDCLSSIENLEYQLNQIEIIIWDNNSEPEYKKKVRNYIEKLVKHGFSKIQFIENNDNFGAFTSRDELIKLADHNTQYILSIDDDVILPPRLIVELLSVVNQDKSIGIIGPRIVFDNNPTQTAHGAGYINWWMGKYYTMDTMKGVECDYIIGCCMLIQKSVFDDIGGFDRDYYTSHGEIDYCVRAKKKGYKIFYYPQAIVRHRVEKGGTKTPEGKYYLYRNKLFVIKKNAPVPQKWVSLFLYSFLWMPKNILESIIRNCGFDYDEVKVMLRAMKDGWLNKAGKKI